MLTIELKTVDELHAIMTELDVINYLQGLVQTESAEQNACTQAYDDAISSAHEQLLDWQTAALDKLRNFVYNENFTHHVEDRKLQNSRQTL